MNDPNVFRSVHHSTKHDHLDDDKPGPTWWQSLLIALAIMVGWVGVNTFFTWIEAPKNLEIAWNVLMTIVSLFLIALGLFYAIGFTKSRTWCQICYPSHNDRY